MSPDWLGSPQHFVAGLLLAAGVCHIARRRLGGVWLPVALAIGATAVSEILVELAEFPLLYRDTLATATRPYLDTLADLGTTLAGALLGAAAAALAPRRRDERHP